MSIAMARHDELIERVVSAHSGHVVRPRGEGDSRFLIFARASDAVRAGCAIQLAMLQERWSLDEPLRIRIAIHTAESVQWSGDYYGPAVNHCARLRSAAHGGQVLISAVTAELVRESLQPEVKLRDLGMHELKDLVRSERIWQVVHPDLPAEFPPPTSVGRRRSNLPAQLNSFVGRELALRQLGSLLASTRLLTLTGPGGIGKTRLALALGERALPDYADGVWLVELAALADPALVASAAATALGIREDGGSPLDQLSELLRHKMILVILDNCEHVLRSSADVAEVLLRACPDLRILATSREPLRAAGETTWRVSSLALARRTKARQIDEKARSEAERLFLERARAARPEFNLTERAGRAVADVCRRLEGIPLALELAAARVRFLGVEQIAAQLDDRFRLLTGGSHTAPPRQQTLRASLEWSYALLSDQEKSVFEQLAVFCGGWTLEAAEAVCGGQGIDVKDVLDLVGQLVDKSLVLVDTSLESPVRYHMLETIREYAHERLVERREAEHVRQRHAQHFVTLGELVRARISGPEQATWLARLECEHDNFRAALDWAATTRNSNLTLQLASGLGSFWSLRGYLTEGLRWLNDGLRDGVAEPRLRASAQLTAANLAMLRGDLELAEDRAQQAFVFYRDARDGRRSAAALRALSMLARYRGAYERVDELSSQALALYRQEGDAFGAALALDGLGFAAEMRGDYPHAHAQYTEQLAAFQTLGVDGGVALALRELAWLDLRQGDDVQAAQRAKESVAVFQRAGLRVDLHVSLDLLASIAARRGQTALAALLFGAMESLRSATGLSLPPYGRSDSSASINQVREALPPHAWAAAWEQGCGMSEDEVIEFAMVNL
jgi:predicted ATPase